MDWADLARHASTFGVGFGTRWGYDKFIVSPKGKKKERERHQQIRALLQQNLERNLAILKEMEQDLRGQNVGAVRKVPTFNVDLAILESTAGLVQLEVLGEVKIYSLVDTARYQLAHVYRMVTALVDMYFRRPRELPGVGTPKSDVAADNVFYDLARTTLALVQNCQSACQKAIAGLDKR